MKTRDLIVALGIFLAARFALSFANFYKLSKAIERQTGKKTNALDIAQATLSAYAQAPAAIFHPSVIQTEFKMLMAPPSTDYSSGTVTSQIPSLLRVDAEPYSPPKWY